MNSEIEEKSQLHHKAAAVTQALSALIYEARQEVATAEAEVARLSEALSFTAGQRDGCRAEVARLREQVSTLREVLMTLQLPATSEWVEQANEALKATDNSGQDAAGD
jgi:chromosome segregation ATPase